MATISFAFFVPDYSPAEISKSLLYRDKSKCTAPLEVLPITQYLEKCLYSRRLMEMRRTQANNFKATVATGITDTREVESLACPEVSGEVVN